MRTRRLAVALACAGLSLACRQPVSPALPTPEQIAALYSYQGDLEAELNGNIAVITVSQPASQLRRGGSLWAKVGPYVVLFSEGTRSLMKQYPALAGVRVVTRVAGGPEIARATMARSELSDVLWRRSLNIAGHARREGTERPALLDALVRWGEDHTEFEYNPRYIRPR
jgi:hypothetical protein